MKRLYINSIFFFILFAVIILLIERFSMAPDSRMVMAEWTDSVSYLTSDGTAEVLPYFEQARTADGTTVLIIGDSVCHQLFNGLQEYNDDMTIIGSNGAITMAGQYILTRLYLDAHPDAEDVYLFVLPECLERTFDTTFGYSYTVLPFVETDTMSLLDEDTRDIMADAYGSFFVEPRGAGLIYGSAVNRKLYLNMIRSLGPGYIQEYPLEIADRYVCKINDICMEHGVRFHLLPCPVSETKKAQVDALRELYECSPIYGISPNYINDVYYYQSEQSGDDTHLSGDYALREALNDKVRIIIAGTDLENSIDFE